MSFMGGFGNINLPNGSGGYGSFGNVNLGTSGGLNKGLRTVFNQDQSLSGGAQANRNFESGSVLGGYNSLVNGGGYSPQEKASISQGSIGGINEAYNSAADAAQRRMAVTHNSAGYGSFLGSLNRQRARDLSTAGLQVQSQFADEALKRKMAGLQGLAQMYGIDSSFLNGIMGNQANLLGIGNSAASRRRGVLGTISGIASVASQI